MHILVYYNNIKHVVTYESLDRSKLHRDEDLPSIIITNSHGMRTQFIWVKNGKQHRLVGPAELDLFGGKFKQFWYIRNFYYKRFNLDNLLYLQKYIKFLYVNKSNKIIWSPFNLGGKFTKKQIMNLFHLSFLN